MYLRNILGIIHCQILEGKYSDAKQQIEFQHEVQTGNAAVSNVLCLVMNP
jgi:hypothetical protein